MRKSYPYFVIDEFYSRFRWVQCFFCRDYIKKEKMWKVRKIYRISLYNVTRFVCKECCPAKHDILKKMNPGVEDIKAPPPPPRKE